MPSPKINVVAVLVAAVVAFVIGFVWYSPPLFGNLWLQAHGFTPEQMEAMKGSLARVYCLSFLCQVVMAVVLGLLLDRTATSGAGPGAGLAFLVWLGFAATIGLTTNRVLRCPDQSLLHRRRLPIGVSRRDGRGPRRLASEDGPHGCLTR